MLHEAQSGAGKGSNPRKHVTVELEPTPRIRPEEVRISSRDNVIGWSLWMLYDNGCTSTGRLFSSGHFSWSVRPPFISFSVEWVL